MLRRLFAVGAVAGAGVSVGSGETPAPESLGITFEREPGRHRELVAHADGSVHLVSVDRPRYSSLSVQTEGGEICIGTADKAPESVPDPLGGEWTPPYAIFGRTE